MKILVIASPNSLSHILKAKSIGKSLADNGHKLHYATTPKYAHCFINRFHPIPDIQESDLSPFPTFIWYSDEDKIKNCIKSEFDLIQKIKPDLVIGIFRFTTKTAAQLANVPYYSVASGCIMPNQKATLGFYDGEDNNQNQRYYLKCFNEFATHKLNKAHKSFGHPPSRNILDQLIGDMTFFWDFEDFYEPVVDYPHQHIGPIDVSNLMNNQYEFVDIEKCDLPKALISLGTCNSNPEFIVRMTKILLKLGFGVVLCLGKNISIADPFQDDPRVFAYQFLPFKKTLDYCDLVVCHGGQLTLFEAFEKKVPALIFPFHPEQAQNGVCAESINCGERIVNSTVFSGDPEVYAKRFMQLTDSEIEEKIHNLINSQNHKKSLSRISEIIKELPGEMAITNHIEKVA